MRNMWHIRKNNKMRYLKIHVIVNVKTKKILSMNIIDEHIHDSKILPELINDVIKSDKKITIGNLFADGSYGGNEIFRYMRHSHNLILLIFILNSISSASPKHILY